MLIGAWEERGSITLKDFNWDIISFAVNIGCFCSISIITGSNGYSPTLYNACGEDGKERAVEEVEEVEEGEGMNGGEGGERESWRGEFGAENENWGKISWEGE